jgi:hypothetical protein
MEPQRAVDVNNRGVEAQKHEAKVGLGRQVVDGWHHSDRHPDLHQNEKSDPIMRKEGPGSGSTSFKEPQYCLRLLSNLTQILSWIDNWLKMALTRPILHTCHSDPPPSATMSCFSIF